MRGRWLRQLAFSNVLSTTPDAQGQLRVGVSTLETGVYTTTGRGKNKTVTFTLTFTFTAGDGVVMRAYAMDQNGLPLANASVDIALSGPESANLTTGLSDSQGVAEAVWQPTAPNKKGRAGTTPGLYEATTINPEFPF